MTNAAQTAQTAPAASMCDCTDCGRQQPAAKCPDCGGRGTLTRPTVRAVVRLVVRG